jgi:hypothetical protein
MRHVILKQVIDFITDGAGDVFQLQQRLSDLCSSEILQTLSRDFDSCSNDDVVNCLDQIVIELGELSEEDLYKEESIRIILDSISSQVLEQLRTHVAKAVSDTKTFPLSIHAFDNWIFYMKHGYIRWNVVNETNGWEEQILESVATNQKSVETLRSLILTDEHALNRIVFQHSDDFKAHVLEGLTAQSQTKLPGYLQQFDSVLIELNSNEIAGAALTPPRMLLWKLILRMVVSNPDQRWTTELIVFKLFLTIVPAPTYFRLPALYAADRPTGCLQLLKLLIERSGQSPDHVNRIVLPSTETQVRCEENTMLDKAETMDNVQDEIPSISTSLSELSSASNGGISDFQQDHDVPMPTDPSGLFVKHAGLVVLHPFISRFFGYASLVVDNKFIDSFHRNKAVLLLQYLAVGDVPCPEHELVMAKLLCGSPIAQAVDLSVGLTPEEKTSADELLRDVIGHWSILKTTTPDGIREGFLQRTGKYHEENTRHFLHVENSGIDILLDHLPWGLSLVKLPWMKYALNIQWR